MVQLTQIKISFKLIVERLFDIIDFYVESIGVILLNLGFQCEFVDLVFFVFEYSIHHLILEGDKLGHSSQIVPIFDPFLAVHKLIETVFTRRSATLKALKFEVHKLFCLFTDLGSLFELFVDFVS